LVWMMFVVLVSCLGEVFGWYFSVLV